MLVDIASIQLVKPKAKTFCTGILISEYIPNQIFQSKFSHEHHVRQIRTMTPLASLSCTAIRTTMLLKSTKSNRFIKGKTNQAYVQARTAMTKPQLATGPQKWVVLGPTGLFRNDLSAVAMAESSPSRKLKSPAHATDTESPDRIHNCTGSWAAISTRRRRCIARGSTGLERGKGYLAQLSAAAAEGMETSRRTEGEEFGW